ncbi:MAG TPA: dehydrogenase [Thermoplasmatales archaeon]|nr:dehydrogenase [Thermoplasmatales archaeon]
MAGYKIKPFTKARRNIELLLESRRKHIIHSLVEADVTEARRKIREYKKKGTDISFTAWFIKCFVEAMKEEKMLNSIRHGKRKIVIFEDVDVALPIEREFEDETRPVAYIIRQANEKSIEEITQEIRKAQREEVGKETQVIGEMDLLKRVALSAPTFIQKFLLWILGRNAFIKKKYAGTTAVTAVGMKGNFGGWLIVMGGEYTTTAAIGGIAKKVVMRDGEPEEREFLRFIINVDHDLIDGAPLARFSKKLVDLLEESFGL